MKTFLTTAFAILLFTITCKAQWTTSGTNIYNSNTGNVGIGTTTPTAGKLVIDANTAAPSIVLHITNSAGGAGNNGAITFGGGGSSAGAYGFIDYNPSSGAGIRHSALGPLVFGTNTNAGYGSSTFTETMRITASGNVGIGTASPTSKLVVAPGVVNSSIDQTISLISSAGQNSFGGYIGQRVINANTRQGLVVSGTGSLTLQAQNYNMDFVTGAVTPTDDTNLRMRILASGNVGIGTANPDQALTVNGTVHSKAVVVDNSIFPDYVFNKTYALRPLSAVKTYIDLNHHLPEMPSAAEVAKNGQNLGEVNTLLLKKVEELTLYMIEKDRQLQEQQKAMSQQNERIKTLEQAILKKK